MATATVCDVGLTKEQLLFLGRYAAVEASACSPFAKEPAPGTLPPVALEDLMTRGLISPQGVEPGLLWTLQLAKGASAYAGVALRGDALEMEVACFFAPPYACALLNAGVGLRLVSPPPLTVLAGILGEIVGRGAGPATELRLELSFAASWTLSAVLDLRRREALAATLGSRSEPLHTRMLEPWAGRRDRSAQWLSSHFERLLERKGYGVDARAAVSGLAELRASGLVACGADGGLQPSELVTSLVRPFVLLDHAVELQAGTVDGGEKRALDIQVVRGLSGALLLWEPDGRNLVHWQTPSALAVREMAADLLSNAQALEALAARP